MSGITDPTEAYFKDGSWGWDGTQWRKLALLWGYSDRVAEDLGETKNGDGNYSAYSTAVPSGEVHVVQMVSLLNADGARGHASFLACANSTRIAFAYDTTPIRYIPMVWNGNLVLKEGDKVRLGMLSCINGDVLEGGVWGYKMKVLE